MLCFYMLNGERLQASAEEVTLSEKFPWVIGCVMDPGRDRCGRKRLKNLKISSWNKDLIMKVERLWSYKAQVVFLLTL